MPRRQKPRVIIIIQARMGASRLPGKPLKTVLGRELLSYQLERLKRSKLADEVIVATTTAPQDQQIVDLCKREGAAFFRGSEQDVLDRYYQAAKAFHGDVVIRVTGDCPLIDPHVVDQVIDFYLKANPKFDYASNMLMHTYPRGMDVEIFSFHNLERAAKEGNRPEDREHVTPHFYENPDIFKLGSLVREADESHHRWTVDTDADFKLISTLLTALYPTNPNFTMEDILKQLRLHPDWFAINAHIKQKPMR